ncbi:hypothetical protein BDZ89DRAFT_1064284, partial [Hymenopellis radicata]
MKIAPPGSMGANMTIMVQEIRALGAEPILVTSLTRRSFNDDGTIADTLQPWRLLLGWWPLKGGVRCGEIIVIVGSLKC